MQYVSYCAPAMTTYGSLDQNHWIPQTRNLYRSHVYIRVLLSQGIISHQVTLSHFPTLTVASRPWHYRTMSYMRSSVIITNTFHSKWLLCFSCQTLLWWWRPVGPNSIEGPLITLNSTRRATTLNTGLVCLHRDLRSLKCNPLFVHLYWLSYLSWTLRKSLVTLSGPNSQSWRP
jgi:hypothetical protein